MKFSIWYIARDKYDDSYYINYFIDGENIEYFSVAVSKNIVYDVQLALDNYDNVKEDILDNYDFEEVDINLYTKKIIDRLFKQ